VISIKKIKRLFTCGLACLFFSCVTTDFISREGLSIAQPDVSILYNDWISNKFELDRIVPIETTADYIISDVLKRVILYKDKLIILDDNWPSIFVLNAYNGKVETHINRKGRGPGESRKILDIAFDDQNEQILVYNDYGRLIYFSLEGLFLKDEKVNHKLYEEMIYHEGNLIFYNHRQGVSCFPYLFDIYNLTDQTWKKLGTNQKVDFTRRISGCLLVKSKNIWFAPVLDMCLHMLDMDSNVIKTPYRLDVKNPLTKELQKKQIKDDFNYFNKHIVERNIIYAITSIRETENYIVFVTNKSLMMMDKDSHEIHSMKLIKDDYLGTGMLSYYPHDGDDNRIMCIIHSSFWMNRKPTVQDIPEHLKAQIEMVKVDKNIESNPILVFYKEK